MNPFFWLEKSFLYENFRKIEHIFTNFWLFRKIIIKISNFQLLWSHTTNPEKILMNDTLEIYQKPQQNCLRSSMDYWKCDENSWKFRRKLILICGGIRDNQDLMDNFHQAAKIKKHACKTFHVWTKNEEKVEDFKDFLIKISIENWLFQILY